MDTEYSLRRVLDENIDDMLRRLELNNGVNILFAVTYIAEHNHNSFTSLD